MYETRILGGGRGSGLGGGSRGPVDVLLNGAVGLVLAYLAFTLIEPFWSGAVEAGWEVKFQSDVKIVADAIRRYELKQGQYRGGDLQGLKAFLSTIPDDPWGNPYQVDAFFGRILTGGKDGVVGTELGDPAGADDWIEFFRPVYRLRAVVENQGQLTPYLMLWDGSRAEPVGGKYPAGSAQLVTRESDGLTLAAASGEDRTLDLASVKDEAVQWLATGPGDDDQPAFGPSHAYFRSVRDAPKPLIYRVEIGGGAVEKVTDPPGSDEPAWDGDHAPAVDPVAGHLAFHSRRRGAEPRVCFVPKGEPGARVAVMPPGLPAGEQPAWSRDGKFVFFLGVDGRTIFRLGVPPKQGSRPEEIGLPGVVRRFAVSPDESKLALAVEAGDRQRLEVLDLETRKSRTVFVEAGRIRHVGWLP